LASKTSSPSPHIWMIRKFHNKLLISLLTSCARGHYYLANNLPCIYSLSPLWCTTWEQLWSYCCVLGIVKQHIPCHLITTRMSLSCDYLLQHIPCWTYGMVILYTVITYYNCACIYPMSA
jgi:hypothetical protein